MRSAVLRIRFRLLLEGGHRHEVLHSRSQRAATAASAVLSGTESAGLGRAVLPVRGTAGPPHGPRVNGDELAAEGRAVLGPLSQGHSLGGSPASLQLIALSPHPVALLCPQLSTAACQRKGPLYHRAPSDSPHRSFQRAGHFSGRSERLRQLLEENISGDGVLGSG